MIAVQLVFQLGDAVSLVLIAKVFYSMTLLTQGADDLLGLLGWDAGVVPALNDHERRLNVVDLCDGRHGAEDLPMVRQRAVFAFAVCAAVFRRIFKEGHIPTVSMAQHQRSGRRVAQESVMKPP